MPFCIHVTAMVIAANGILPVQSFAEHPALSNIRERACPIIENVGLIYVIHFEAVRRVLFRAQDIGPHTDRRVPAGATA